jgi:hypothetical protein
MAREEKRMNIGTHGKWVMTLLLMVSPVSYGQLPERLNNYLKWIQGTATSQERAAAKKTIVIDAPLTAVGIALLVGGIVAAKRWKVCCWKSYSNKHKRHIVPDISFEDIEEAFHQVDFDSNAGIYMDLVERNTILVQCQQQALLITLPNPAEVVPSVVMKFAQRCVLEGEKRKIHVVIQRDYPTATGHETRYLVFNSKSQTFKPTSKRPNYLV